MSMLFPLWSFKDLEAKLGTYDKVVQVLTQLGLPAYKGILRCPGLNYVPLNTCHTDNLHLSKIRTCSVLRVSVDITFSMSPIATVLGLTTGAGCHAPYYLIGNFVFAHFILVPRSFKQY